MMSFISMKKKEKESLFKEEKVEVEEKRTQRNL